MMVINILNKKAPVINQSLSVVWGGIEPPTQGFSVQTLKKTILYYALL